MELMDLSAWLESEKELSRQLGQGTIARLVITALEKPEPNLPNLLKGMREIKERADAALEVYKRENPALFPPTTEKESEG